MTYKENPTEEAKNEMVELNKAMEINQTERNKEWQNKEMPYDYRQFRVKKLDREYSKLYDKKREIEDLGISSKEKTKILRLLPDFNLVTHEKETAGIYPTDDKYIKEGIWNNTKIRVTYKKWSSFMRNVQGMKSLAGKLDIDKIEKI